MSEIFTNEGISFQIDLADSKISQNQILDAIEIYKFLLDKTNEDDLLKIIYNKLANAYYSIKDLDNAIWAYENLLHYSRNDASTYNMLGFLYFYKDSDKSIENYLKGMELKPDLKNFIMLAQLMIKSVKFSQKDLKLIFEKYIDIFRPQILKEFTPYTYNPKEYHRDKKLKIGYLSSDLYNHAMMSFILPIIENHDTEKFEVYLYQTKEKYDFVSERLQSKGAKFKDCSKITNYEIAKLIHEDKIDILIDISGYTHNAVLSLLYKPAPIIIQYLGFLGTYGMKEVDYIIADKFTIPRNIKKYYTEKPIYIDCGMNRFTFQKKDKTLPKITPLPYEQNGYITLGCFNSMSKINHYTINLWSKVLKSVPNSKLLIYRTQMQQRDIDRFKKMFCENEINNDRIIFDNQPMPDSHMSSYLKCDFSLDPIPFSGLTVTIEQAFMGVPVLTLPGETIASKGTARINRIIGLKDFIAKNEKDYIKKAVKISSNIDKLKFYRQNLPEIIKKSYLCNGFEHYTRKIEKEYIKVWHNFCKK